MLIKNTVFLFFLQIFNYLSPILVLPFLSRVLATEILGSVMIAMAIIQIVAVFTDYGFSISATYRISLANESKKKISCIISRVYGAKIIIFFFVMVALFVFINLTKYYEIRLTIYAGVGAMIGQMLQAPWFFQGVQRFSSYFVFAALSKISYVLLIYVFIGSNSSGQDVVLLWSFSNILGAVISIFLMYRMGYAFYRVSIKSCFTEVRKGFGYFLSRISVVIYTSASAVVLGFGDLKQVAYFSAAEQLYKGGQSLMVALSQAIFPKLAKEKSWGFFWQVMPKFYVVVFFGSIVGFVFSDFWVSLFFGNEFKESSKILKVFMVTLLVNYWGTALGYPALSILGNLNFANKSVIYASMVYCFVLGLLLYFHQVNSYTVALCILLAECFVFFIRLIYIVRCSWNQK